MRNKLFICFILLVCLGLSSQSQTNYTASFGALRYVYKGGFDHSKDVLKLGWRTFAGGASFRFGVSHFEEGKNIGFAAGFALSGLSHHFYNPTYYLCVVGPTGEIRVCQDNAIFATQVHFMSFQFDAGPALRIGQFLEFSVTPFLGRHARKSSGGIGLDPNFQIPGTYSDMYNRYELGGQSRLTLRLNIGKHFSVNLQGNAGITFTDMRKDQWRDARAVVSNALPGSEWIPLESSKLTRRFYGLFLGIGLKW